MSDVACTVYTHDAGALYTLRSVLPVVERSCSCHVIIASACHFGQGTGAGAGAAAPRQGRAGRSSATGALAPGERPGAQPTTAARTSARRGLRPPGKCFACGGEHSVTVWNPTAGRTAGCYAVWTTQAPASLGTGTPGS